MREGVYWGKRKIGCIGCMEEEWRRRNMCGRNVAVGEQGGIGGVDGGGIRRRGEREE